MKQAAFSAPPQCILNTSEHILVSKDNKDIPQVCSYVKLDLNTEFSTKSVLMYI